ncbi:MAG: hypothetical protein DMF09_10160 [Verrucomicrobia bacterium]|nr:MAG: hypothetical protein DMF09_10160 [Verrucomicrobiota bacterium]
MAIWIPHASRVLASASSRSRAVANATFQDAMSHNERLFRRDAETNTRDAYATQNAAQRF